MPAACRAAPTGSVRISCVAAFYNAVVMPWLAPFLATHPGLSVEARLQTRRPIDLVEEGIDLGIRFGPIRQQSLIARRLGRVDFALFAAPAYLARAGDAGDAGRPGAATNSAVLRGARPSDQLLLEGPDGATASVAMHGRIGGGRDRDDADRRRGRARPGAAGALGGDGPGGDRAAWCRCCRAGGPSRARSMRSGRAAGPAAAGAGGARPAGGEGGGGAAPQGPVTRRRGRWASAVVAVPIDLAQPEARAAARSEAALLDGHLGLERARRQGPPPNAPRRG